MRAVDMRKITFQSTPPVKAATKTPAASAKAPDISIHAAREGGDLDATMSYDTSHGISIHAAREGGDENQPYFTPPYLYFNPRRP